MNPQHPFPDFRYGPMRMVFILAFFFPLITFSQNLLLNGSFEEENLCTEYNVNCAPEAWIYTVPSFIYYFKSEGLAHTGTHFIALVAGHAHKPYYRTFVRSRLLCGLRKGNTYRLQFFIKSRHAILDSVGVYFSTYDFLFEKKAYRKIDASVYLTDAAQRPARSDTNWQQMEISYTAQGGESFITLGNFSKADVTGTTGVDRENNFFVLFDDISLVPADKNEKLCSNWQQNREEIYAQDERHEYLDRQIKYHRNQPLETVETSLTVVQKIDTVVIPDILFESGKSSLSAPSYMFMDSMYAGLSSSIIDSIVVEGHTDSIGTVENNQKLGYARASAVVDYFRAKYVKTNFIARSWASEKPVADNRTAGGRQRNRRVEVYVYLRE